MPFSGDAHGRCLEGALREHAARYAALGEQHHGDIQTVLMLDASGGAAEFDAVYGQQLAEWRQVDGHFLFLALLVLPALPAFLAPA